MGHNKASVEMQVLNLVVGAIVSHGGKVQVTIYELYYICKGMASKKSIRIAS